MIAKKIILLFTLIPLFAGCYSFTGASIAPDVKTFHVEFFPNKASIVNPTLSNDFTNNLKEYISSQARLSESENNPDIEISGEIKNYSINAIAIQGNDKAALNRLTITIFVEYKNRKKPDQNFSESFSRYGDFNSSLNFSSVESDLCQIIIKEIITDIYNRAFANW